MASVSFQAHAKLVNCPWSWPATFSFNPCKPWQWPTYVQMIKAKGLSVRKTEWNRRTD